MRYVELICLVEVHKLTVSDVAHDIVECRHVKFPQRGINASIHLFPTGHEFFTPGVVIYVYFLTKAR